MLRVVQVVQHAFEDLGQRHLVARLEQVDQVGADTGHVRRRRVAQAGATGRTISVRELAMYRFEDGRIAECWGDLGSSVRDQLIDDHATAGWGDQER